MEKKEIKDMEKKEKIKKSRQEKEAQAKREAEERTKQDESYTEEEETEEEDSEDESEDEIKEEKKIKKEELNSYNLAHHLKDEHKKHFKRKKSITIIKKDLKEEESEALKLRIKNIYATIDQLRNQNEDIGIDLNLDCSNLKATDSDFIDIMVYLKKTIEEIEKNNKKQKQSCNNDISTKKDTLNRRYSIKIFSKPVSQSPKLKLSSLNLSNNKINETTLDLLNQILQESNLVINELNLSNVDFGSMNRDNSFNINLNLLDENNLSSVVNSNLENHNFLKELISSCKISKIFLDNCNLTEEHASTIANSLKKNPYIEYISINDNPKIGSNGLLKIVKTMTEMMNLRNARLSNVGATLDKLLGKEIGLLGKTKLESLDLSENKITDSKCLSEIIRQNETLRELILKSCEIKDIGLLEIIRSLKKSKLKILNLSENGITKTGIQLLTALMKKRKEKISVERLDLSNNNIDQQSALNLYPFILTNSKIKQIILDGNSEISEETLTKINKINKEKLEKEKEEKEKEKEEVFIAIPSAPSLPISQTLQSNRNSQNNENQQFVTSSSSNTQVNQQFVTSSSSNTQVNQQFVTSSSSNTQGLYPSLPPSYEEANKNKNDTNSFVQRIKEKDDSKEREKE